MIASIIAYLAAGISVSLGLLFLVVGFVEGAKDARYTMVGTAFFFLFIAIAWGAAKIGGI